MKPRAAKDRCGNVHAVGACRFGGDQQTHARREQHVLPCVSPRAQAEAEQRQRAQAEVAQCMLISTARLHIGTGSGARLNVALLRLGGHLDGLDVHLGGALLLARLLLLLPLLVPAQCADALACSRSMSCASRQASNAQLQSALSLVRCNSAPHTSPADTGDARLHECTSQCTPDLV